jgi:hypothetical protein
MDMLLLPVSRPVLLLRHCRREVIRSKSTIILVRLREPTPYRSETSNVEHVTIDEDEDADLAPRRIRHTGTSLLSRNEEQFVVLPLFHKAVRCRQRLLQATVRATSRL